MNELNTRLLEYLPDPNTVKGGIGSVVETLQDEAPIMVEELLAWSSTVSMVWFVVWIVFACLSLVLLIISAKCVYDNDEYLPACFLSVGMMLGCVAGACCCLTWWQIQIAPRLFLLEYVGNLLT